MQREKGAFMISSVELAKQLMTTTDNLMGVIRRCKLSVEDERTLLSCEEVEFLRIVYKDLKLENSIFAKQYAFEPNRTRWQHSFKDIKGEAKMNDDSKESFDKKFEEEFEKKNPNYNETLNIALVGKVSAGKSSLLNSLLQRTRSNKVAKVSADAGTTVNIRPLKFNASKNDNVLIIDSPGLNDVKIINSEITKKFLVNIDVGIFVVHGPADEAQKAGFDELKTKAKKTFLVLNMIDIWDTQPKSLEKVKKQWCEYLGVTEIYPTCCKGYDDDDESGVLDIRGVDELRDNILIFLEKEGKAIHLAKHLAKKESFVYKVIAVALLAVAGAAFIPGSAAYITAIQVVAIGTIYYIMTGEVLSKVSILALLPTFIARSAGVTLFLWAKSLLPPTGVLDILAAVVAVGITFAMLAAVYTVLNAGMKLDGEQLGIWFNKYKKTGAKLVQLFKEFKLEDFKHPERIMPKIIAAIASIIES